MSMPTVSVLVPVYNAEAFIADTLVAIEAQSFEDFEVLISIDRGEDDSARICREFEDDPRFRVFEQDQRLNWVGNINFLISQMRGAYGCVAPHDDLMDEAALAEMLDVMETLPTASLVFPEIHLFGDLEGRGLPGSVTGDVEARILSYLVRLRIGVGFRGLWRRGLEGPPLMRSYEFNSFGADHLWMLEFAVLGELIAASRAKIYKRMHEESTTARQLREWSPADMVSATRILCTQLLAIAWHHLDRREARAEATRRCVQRFFKTIRHLSSSGYLGGVTRQDLAEEARLLVLRAGAQAP